MSACSSVGVDAGVCFQSTALSIERERCVFNENMVTVSKHLSLLKIYSDLACPFFPL